MIAQRVKTLEQELAALKREAVGWFSREASLQPPVGIRFARIISGGGTPGSATCGVLVYNIQFVDATFPETAGVQTISASVRSSNIYQAAAPEGLELASNDVVLLAKHNDRWWVIEKYGECVGSGSSSTPSSSSGPSASSGGSGSSGGSDSSGGSGSSGSGSSGSSSSSCECGACGLCPLLDSFDDVNGTTLDNHTMDDGCGWEGHIGSITDFVIQANNCRISVEANTVVKTCSCCVNLDVDIEFDLGETTTVGGQIIVSATNRIVDSNNYWSAELRTRQAGNHRLQIYEFTGGSATNRTNTAVTFGGFNKTYGLSLDCTSTQLTASVANGANVESNSYNSTLHNEGMWGGFGHWVSTGTLTTDTDFTVFDLNNN